MITFMEIVKVASHLLSSVSLVETVDRIWLIKSNNLFFEC